MKKKVLISSILTLAVCLAIIAGSTFALFTSTVTVNVAVTAANVNVVAAIQPTVKTWSLTETEANARTDGSFVNGGSAVIDSTSNSTKLVISRMPPGDVAKFTIKVTNNSDVAVQYRVRAISEKGANATVDLTEALTITANVNGVDYAVSGTENVTPWIAAPLNNGAAGNITDMVITVNFPNGTPEHDNAYKQAGADITFVVEAVQGNGVDSNGNLITP